MTSYSQSTAMGYFISCDRSECRDALSSEQDYDSMQSDHRQHPMTVRTLCIRSFLEVQQ